MNGREAFRLFMLIVLMVIIQYTVGLDLRIAGAHPDLMLLMPIAAGVVGGPEIGAATGFAAGIATDLLLPTPFGLSALVYSLVGFSVGYVMDAGGSRREGFWWLTPLIALAASTRSRSCCTRCSERCSARTRWSRWTWLRWSPWSR